MNLEPKALPTGVLTRNFLPVPDGVFLVATVNHLFTIAGWGPPTLYLEGTFMKENGDLSPFREVFPEPVTPTNPIYLRVYLGKGYLVSACITGISSTFNYSCGQLIGEIGLYFNSATDTDLLYRHLAKGILGAASSHIAWPSDGHDEKVDPNVLIWSPTNPGAGNALSQQGASLGIGSVEILAMVFTLTTDANVATRRVWVGAQLGSVTSLMFPAENTQAATLVRRYHFQPRGYLSAVNLTFNAIACLFEDMERWIFCQFHNLNIQAENIQAGDTFTNIRITVRLIPSV